MLKAVRRQPWFTLYSVTDCKEKIVKYRSLNRLDKNAHQLWLQRNLTFSTFASWSCMPSKVVCRHLPSNEGIKIWDLTFVFAWNSAFKSSFANVIAPSEDVAGLQKETLQDSAFAFSKSD